MRSVIFPIVLVAVFLNYQARGQYCMEQTCGDIIDNLRDSSQDLSDRVSDLQNKVNALTTELTAVHNTLTSKMEKQQSDISATSDHLAATQLALGLTASLVAILLIVIIWLCRTVNDLVARKNNGGAVLLND